MPIVGFEYHDASYRLHADPASHIGRRIIEGRQPYEYPLLEDFYAISRRQHGRTGAVAVDVGAHIGNHTLWLAAVCGLTVHSFEPDPDTVAELSRNVILNQLTDQVTIHQAALGAVSGRAEPAGKGIWAKTKKKGEGTVEIRRLDSYKLRGVRLMKLDIEDAEPEALKGAKLTIRRNQPVIYAEARSEAAQGRLRAVLEPMGYEHVDTFNGRLVASPVERWEPVS